MDDGTANTQNTQTGQGQDAQAAPVQLSGDVSLAGEKVLQPLSAGNTGDASGGAPVAATESGGAVAPADATSNDSGASGEQAMDDEAMGKFIDALVEAKQLSSLTPEMIAKIKTELKAKLVEYINLATFDALPDEKLDDLEQALVGGDVDKVRAVFEGSGVDYNKVIGDALVRFGQLYLGEEERGDDSTKVA